MLRDIYLCTVVRNKSSFFLWDSKSKSDDRFCPKSNPQGASNIAEQVVPFLIRHQWMHPRFCTLSHPRPLLLAGKHKPKAEPKLPSTHDTCQSIALWESQHASCVSFLRQEVRSRECSEASQQQQQRPYNQQLCQSPPKMAQHSHHLTHRRLLD